MEKFKTCRCCLKQLSNDEEFYEFSAEMAIDLETVNPVNFIKINDCYLDLTTLFVSENEEDFTKICSSCLADLKFCYLFKKKCVESSKIFEDEGHEIEELNEQNEIESPCKIEVEDNFEFVVEELVETHQEEDNIQENEEELEQDYEEEEMDAEDFKIETSYVPLKRSRLENIEPDEGVIYNCELCTKTFDRKEYYRRHYRRLHLNENKQEQSPKKIFQCDLCGKISTSRENHDEHQMEHEGEPRLKCRKCEKTFSSKDEARKHLLTAHSVEDKPFNCQSCSKTFKNRYQLILHTRTHTGEKPFECPICERSFSMSSNLQKHLDTHSTEKPYQCTYCNQFFKTQRSLKFHTVCHHQPEIKVKCGICEKSFVNKSYLKVHMLYHTGEKNFTCTICNSKYYKSSHLKRHIQNVHFKLRLMKCDYCASDFVRKETYKAHIISHHKKDMTDQEYQQVLENIRKFQVPHLDINQFTVEKQALAKSQNVLSEVDEAEMDEMMEDPKSEEEGMIEAEEYEIFEEAEEDECEDDGEN